MTNHQNVPPTRTDTIRSSNQDGGIDGTSGNDRFILETNLSKSGNRPYSMSVRAREGNDTVGLDAYRSVNASLNGGSGNDLFLINLTNFAGNINKQNSLNPDVSVVNVNGDAGVDTVRIFNPSDFTLRHDGHGRVSLTAADGRVINLNGIEKIEYVPAKPHSLCDSKFIFDLNLVLGEISPNVSRNLESVLADQAQRC